MSNPESYELLVVGAGPTALTAAVGTGAEDLTTLVLYEHLGGQAGTTSKIRNLPFYPEGITGPDLIGDMVDTNRTFETQFKRARVEAIDRSPEGILILHEDTRTYFGKAALIACGVESRHIDAKNIDLYTDGHGVEFRAPDMQLEFDGDKVFVVGGGNSAGQAAQYLSTFVNCDVNLIIRGSELGKSMSAYLVEDIQANPKVNVHFNTAVTAVDGKRKLQEVTLKTGDKEETLPADKLFVLIGADPRTAWLPQIVERDERGYVLAGHDLPKEVVERFREEEKREPYAHETAMPGVFVAGDVRHNSIPRVASAVGEGMVAAQEIWNYLKLIRLGKPTK